MKIVLSKTPFQLALMSAQNSLWSSFVESLGYVQRGDIGDHREDALTHFLEQRLPARYAIARGEVVDTRGTRTGQTDILIYDRSSTTPLITGRNVVLPAEALLATIEVKTTLSADEISKSVSGIKALHDLRPWDAPYAVVNGPQGIVTDSDLPRILTSIFAYKSNLSVDNWHVKEMRRVREACTTVGLPVPCVDRVVVLNRGLLNPAPGVALVPGEKEVLGYWFFNLVNFLAREAGRRKAFPWNDYQWPMSHSWIVVEPPSYNAPAARRATTSERLKARKARHRGR